MLKIIMNRIQKQIDYFNQNKKQLFETHSGRVAVIGSDMNISVYDTPLQAYEAAIKSDGYGNFMIKDMRKVDTNTVNIVTPTITTTL